MSKNKKQILEAIKSTAGIPPEMVLEMEKTVEESASDVDALKGIQGFLGKKIQELQSKAEDKEKDVKEERKRLLELLDELDDIVTTQIDKEEKDYIKKVEEIVAEDEKDLENIENDIAK